MKKDSAVASSRRDLIKAIGGTVVIVPVLGLGACSGGPDSPAPADTPPPGGPGDAAPTGGGSDATATAGASETAPSGDAAARLSEDAPQAKSLGYVHDASSIDSAAQPRYQPGQICANCALYQAEEGAEWGDCSIFPGRQVKASGWCTVYAPKAS